MLLLLTLLWVTARISAAPLPAPHNGGLRSRLHGTSSSSAVAEDGHGYAHDQEGIRVHEFSNTVQKQPLRLEELSTVDLFKALLVYQTVVPQKLDHVGSRSLLKSGKNRAEGALHKILEYNPFSTAEYVLHFDTSGPGIRIPRDSKDLQVAVQSLVFGKYYRALGLNHDESLLKTGAELSSKPSTGWLDQIRPEVRRVTTSQIVKEGLTAAERTRIWAQQVFHPGQLDHQQLEQALKRASNLWHAGIINVSGDTNLSIEQISSKLLRR